MTPAQIDALEEFSAGLGDDDIYYTAVFYITSVEAGMKGFGGFENEAQAQGCIRALRKLADEMEKLNHVKNGHTLQ